MSICHAGMAIPDYIMKITGNSTVSVIIVIVTNTIGSINILNHPKSSPTQNLHKSEKATTCPRGRGLEPPDSKAPIDTIAPSARSYKQLHLCNSSPVPGSNMPWVERVVIPPLSGILNPNAMDIYPPKSESIGKNWSLDVLTPPSS